PARQLGPLWPAYAEVFGMGASCGATSYAPLPIGFADRPPPQGGGEVTWAPLYSITLSARSSSDDGTSRPIALAVLRLTTTSNFAGCWTGMSVGLIPCSTFATSRARSRYISL